MLIDEEAVDVSRITGIPWSYERTQSRGVPRPVIDLDRLSWWDRWAVAWTRIGAYHWLHT